MDFTTPNYYQPTSLIFPSQDERQEQKPKKNPFSDPFRKLNLKEAGEFVDSLPMSSSSQRRRSSEVFGGNIHSISNVGSGQVKTDVAAPSTPGRPVFNFSVARKSVPSKWDDAEKWLFAGGGSCQASPAHNAFDDDHGKSYVFGGGNCDVFKSRSWVTRPRMSCDAVVEKVSSTTTTTTTTTRVVKEKEESVQQQQQQHIVCSDVGFSNGAAVVPADLPLKDKFADEIEPFTPNFRYSEPTKEAFLFKSHKLYDEPMKDACTEMIPYQDVKHRDIGTEMTPLGSSTTSRCHTPFKSTSPARHNTPASRSGPLALTAQTNPIDMAQLQECHFAKLQIGTSQFDSATTNWSSREEEEEEISKSLRHFELGRRSVSVSESRACVWEEEEKTKSCIRYRREEAKIQAWVNLQTAKAEAQSRKLEVKIQKMRSNLEEKLMKRMAIVERKAEEWREAAQNEHSEQIRKATERAQKILFNQHHQNSHVSTHIVSCGCFPCTSDH